MEDYLCDFLNDLYLLSPETNGDQDRRAGCGQVHVLWVPEPIWLMCNQRRVPFGVIIFWITSWVFLMIITHNSSTMSCRVKALKCLLLLLRKILLMVPCCKYFSYKDHTVLAGELIFNRISLWIFWSSQEREVDTFLYVICFISVPRLK